MAAAREATDILCRGTDDAEHASLRIERRQIALLYGAQSLGRSGVTTENHKMASHGEKLQHGLTGELIDHLERARTVRRAGVVAKIHVVVGRQQLADTMKYGEPSVSGIEHSDGTRG